MEIQGTEHYESIQFNLPCQGQAHFEIFRNDRRYVEPHWHDSVEIISVLEGALSVTVDQQTYHLQAGNCIILNPYALHSTSSVSGNSGLLLQIPLQTFSDYGDFFLNRHFICDPLTRDPERQRDLARVFEIMTGIMELEESGDPVARLRSVSLLWELLYVLQSRFTHIISQAALSSSQKDRERMEQVSTYTRLHYSEPITLEDIAGELHLQVNYFCHFFKRVAGITYLQFLNEFRLAKVYQDLVTTDIPLKYLLERHGFTNYKRFRELFYERFQTTPNVLRAQRGQNRNEQKAGAPAESTEAPAVS